MMNPKLNEYVEDGSLSVRKTTVNNIEYSIYCYTKDQFFNKEWDDVTISHRGKIYTSYGVVINNPFPKVFNLDEHPTTSKDVIMNLIQNEKYEILDKLNGHLVIVSYDIRTGNVLVSTKGSFDGELAVADRLLVEKLGIDSFIKKWNLDHTLMFECIADYDQHLWYDEQKKKYELDGNSLILLGSISNVSGDSLEHDDVKKLADFMGVPVTKRFKEFEDGKTLDSLFDFKGIEGFVYHFPELNFRFKVKTTEYVALHYMKDIKSEKLINMFYNSGLENMYKELDEELYPIIEAVKEDFCDWFKETIIDTIHVVPELMTKKEIALCETLSNAQRTYLLQGAPHPSRFFDTKSIKAKFKEHGKYPKCDKICVEFFEKRLYTA